MPNAFPDSHEIENSIDGEADASVVGLLKDNPCTSYLKMVRPIKIISIEVFSSLVNQY